MSSSKFPSSQDSVSIEKRNVAIQNVDDGDDNEIEIEKVSENIEERGLVQKRPRKKTSKVWEKFEKVVVREKGVDVEKYMCKNCHRHYKVPKDGTTSHFKRHLDECVSIKPKDKNQSILTLNISENSLAEGDYLTLSTSTKYDQMKIREIIAKMIIVHEYPFKMVEHFWFNVLLKSLNSNYEKVSRATITNDCMKVYGNEKEKLKKALKSVDRVSLTSDTWTSSQTIGYMCLTIHYANSDWKLQKRISNFFELEPPHTGIVIGDAIMDCLFEWGIENKVSAITLDNASSNDVAAKTLLETLRGRGHLFFQGIIFHIRCCAHILNLMAQDGLGEIQGAIMNVRESVKYVKKSYSRLKKFGEIARQLNVPTSRGLCFDVPTRWNSTYNMLDAALIYKSVFQQYKLRDDNYKWLPSEEEWVKVQKIKPFLEVFYDVTHIFSATSSPTANLFLPEVWKVKEIIFQNLTSEDEYIRKMVEVMNTKFDKYWKECNMLMAIAAILDPRFKMRLIEYCFPKIYYSWEVEDNIVKVHESLYKIYNIYAVELASSTSGEEVGQNSLVVGSSSSGMGRGKTKGRAEFEDFLRSTYNVQPFKSEMDTYLEESNVICTDTGDSNFDALDWWRMNTLKFRVLSKMARDILSIPISTVASESAFSAGGRVLDDYRSSLATKTVEALVCTADWLRANQKIFKSPLSDCLEEECLKVVIPDDN